MKVKYVKLINLIVAVLVALFAIGQAFAWFMSGKKTLSQGFGGSSEGAYFAYGTGSKDDPFGINTKYHMYNLAWLQNTGRLTDENGVSKKYYFELDDNLDSAIDMGEYWLPPIGNDENPFISEFDGNGKEIANLKITTKKDLLTANPSSADYAFSNAVGMFGVTGEGSVVSNFILNNPLVHTSSQNTLYSESSNKVVGLAIGHVGGNCFSIGVRALEAAGNAQKTALRIERAQYSTFNSILGELGENVSSSVTGGGHVSGTGSGGSGNAFGANFDIPGLVDRLKLIHANGGASWRLPDFGDYYLGTANEGSKATTLAELEKIPFTVGADSSYTGADAKETMALNNIGYILGNQTKFYSKEYTFGDPMPLVGSSYVHTDGVIPKWIYKRVGNYGANYDTSSIVALSQSEMDALPKNIIKELFPTTGNTNKLDSIAISQTYNNVGVQIYPGSDANGQWSPHGQINWMGKTYGKGFTMTDYKGDAVDENGNKYTANGNLIGENGYEVDENGVYAVDGSLYPDFPYVVHNVGTVYPNVDVALDDSGNFYLRYNPDSSGLYVYGILDGGYIKTGDSYQYYAAPVAGWSQPISLIDADGYAMYEDGVYFDTSGNIVVGEYVKDSNGFYISSDAAFKMPIANIVNGYAQDADGNYYGKITLNGRDAYCYLGADGIAAGYDGWNMIDSDNFIVAASNVDAEGNVKYNETDFYGTLDGVKGYVDANGYFYGANHAYVATDKNLLNAVTIADADGYAMADATKYYGRLKVSNGYTYAYAVKRGGKFYYVKADGSYGVDDNTFGYAVKKIDDEGYAMTDDGAYYGRYRKDGNYPYTYGRLVEAGGVSYLQKDGKFIINDASVAYQPEKIDAEGYAMTGDYYYGWTKNNIWDGNEPYTFVKLNSEGYIYDDTPGYTLGTTTYDLPKGYTADTSHWSFANNKITVCTEEGENYGYFLKDGVILLDYATGQKVKAWGYTDEEVAGGVRLQLDEWNYVDLTFKSGNKFSVCTGEKFKVQEGEPIAVEKGVIDKAISSSEINGIEGQFITPKEIEKVKVVTASVGGDGTLSLATGIKSDKLEKVLVQKASPVALYSFLDGVPLPNNGIWFKPSQAGTIRILLFADKAGKGVTLIQGHRPSATKENPFLVDYSVGGGDMTRKEVAKCDLPAYVLCYFEYTITPEEIEDGRYEYWIVKNDSGGGAGANFVYLDLGSSAADDDSGIDREKNVSAVDFIYRGVTISDTDAADGAFKVGDFIINGAKYESSKTSVYFDNMQTVLEIVFVRLSGSTDGKTIKVGTSVATAEVTATDPSKIEIDGN